MRNAGVSGVESKAKSWNHWLTTFAIGERRYVETTLKTYPAQMRTMNAPRSRRPESISGWEFTSILLTAVATGNAGDIRYLICVERTK
jgi:hypothetical protein